MCMFWALDLKHNLNTGFAWMQFDAFINVLNFNHIGIIFGAYINKFRLQSPGN